MDLLPTTLYKMRTNHDCGPRLIRSITGVAYEKVLRVQGWPSDEECNSSFLDFLDSPWHHFVAIERLGLSYRIRTLKDLLENKCEPGRTAILVHDLDNPFLAQHWVGLAEVNIDKRKVWIYWGMKGKVAKEKTFEEMEELYAKGSPACVYTVYKGGTNGCDGTTLYMRLYALATSALVRIVIFLSVSRILRNLKKK